MRIRVTQDNINHGLRGSCTSDPVALALRDEGFLKPYVTAEKIQVDGRLGWRILRQTAPAPYSVYDFIHSFDQGEPVSPFSFEVDL